MNCGTCNQMGPGRTFTVGERVTVNRWEKVWSGRDLKGTVVAIGKFGVSVKWDHLKRPDINPPSYLLPEGHPAS